MTEYLKALEELQHCISDGTWPGGDSLRFWSKKEIPTGKAIWRSGVDPADLKFSTESLGPVQGNELLTKESFLRFMGLEPELSPLLRSAARASCSDCGREMYRTDRGSVINGLTANSGFLVLALKINESQLLKLPVSIAMDLVGAHSVVVQGRRIAGAPLSEMAQKLVGELEDLALVQRTFSLPLSDSDKEEIIVKDPASSGAVGDTQFCVLKSLGDEINFSPLDAEFFCAACSKYELNVSQDRLILGGYPLSQINDLTISAIRDSLRIFGEKGRCDDKLRLLSEAGFAQHPIGLPLGTLSSRELLRLLVARFMLSAGGDLRLDLSSVPGLLSSQEMQSLQSKFTAIEVPASIATREAGQFQSSGNKSLFKVGPYRAEPFVFPELQMTRKALNILEGDGDFLLDLIYSDSKVKREFSQVKYLSEGEYEKNSAVIESLGLTSPVAKVLASSYEARSTGVTEKDLNFTSSKKVCSKCRKVGVLLNLECEDCEGEVLKVSSPEIRFQGILFADLLRRKISEIAPQLSGIREFRSYIYWLNRFSLTGTALGDRVESLPLPQRECLPLVRFLAELPTSPALILMRNPARALPESESCHLAACLRELLGQGHTLVISDSSGRFYETAGTVIRLQSEFKDSRNRLVKEDR